jgi:coenzyme F420 hydrogenase subunit delta
MAQQKHSSIVSTVIFGCGNLIMGDDGFGPEVVAWLNSKYALPHGVAAIDAGTGVREYLFDYLLSPEDRPQRIILLDAVDFHDRKPGEVFSIEVAAIPPQKVHDFSLHQFPTVNLIAELQEHTGIMVDIVVAQVEHIPEQIEPGLSQSMKKAVPVAGKKVAQMISMTDAIC